MRREIPFEKISILSFDCYGTLIDWETGILKALEPVLQRHGVRLTEEEVLELYGRLESEIEAGPFRRYRDVLEEVVRKIGKTFGFSPSEGEIAVLWRSLPEWPPFSDTVPSLKRLSKRFQLAILSNVDDDLFAGTRQHLGVEFDWVVTAQQVRSYKPAKAHFRTFLRRVDRDFGEVVHVAQSLYHDIRPASEMGLYTVWLDRRKNRPGCGATPPAEAKPDMVVYSLNELVQYLSRKGIL